MCLIHESVIWAGVAGDCLFLFHMISALLEMEDILQDGPLTWLAGGAGNYFILHGPLHNYVVTGFQEQETGSEGCNFLKA